MLDLSKYEKYRGKRALILTRVSGKLQAQKYGHAAQERNVREEIIVGYMVQRCKR